MPPWRAGSRLPEAVARAAHREDQLGLARVALDLLPQVADVDVDRARLAVVRAAPDALEQLAPAEHDARVGGERAQQLELDERQLRSGSPRTSTDTAWEVDPQPSPRSTPPRAVPA